MKPSLLLASLLLCAGTLLGSCEANNHSESTTPQQIGSDVLVAAECASIDRLHEKGGIYLSSQPQIADFEQVKSMGLRTVINQRPRGENKDFDEEQVVRELGLAYLNPGWNGPEQFTDEILDKTREMLRDAERPLLIHCASANRTGATWLAYRVLDEGAELEAAVLEAKTVGMRSETYEQMARDYVARMQSK